MSDVRRQRPKPCLLVGLPLLILGSEGCSDDVLRAAEADLIVDPPRIQFEEGCLEVQTATLSVSNRGLAQVRIEELLVEPSGLPFTADTGPSGWTRLEPGETQKVSVDFRPSSEDSFRAELVLRTSVGDRRVPLAAAVAPYEVRVPSEVDFGTVDEGSPVSRSFEVIQIGGTTTDGALFATWTSTSIDLRPATDGNALGPLKCKTPIAIPTTYDPVDKGRDQGRWVVRLSGADRTVSVHARANLRPRAELDVCSAPQEGPGCESEAARISAASGSVVALDASRSLDPEGQPLRFEWRILEAPDGSRTGVFAAEPTLPYASVQLDRDGRYRFQVRARDERGLTGEAEVEVSQPDLQVSLTWDVATDLDLHLVRPDGVLGDYGSGAPAESQGSDCSTFNRAPDWASPDSVLDDPRLDRDAVETPGPERVLLDRPEPGAYRVYVHYCDSRDRRVAARPEVTLESRGRALSELGPERSLLPGEVWPAIELSWNAESELWSIIPLAESIEARPELCRSN